LADLKWVSQTENDCEEREQTLGLTIRNADENIEEYHAHIYFLPSTRKSAVLLYESLQQIGQGKIHLNSIADGPRGPHVHCMFGVDIPKAMIEPILGFLMLNHGPHSVLIHPVTKNELLDHTHHALWLGQQQPLDLAVLA
jgi:DOPA 4,5-dioxygenase